MILFSITFALAILFVVLWLALFCYNLGYRDGCEQIHGPVDFLCPHGNDWDYCPVCCH